MPRNKAKRGGVDNGPRGRRGHRGHGGNKGRSARRRQQQDMEEDSDDEQGVLRIGGVVIRVDDSGHVLSQQRQGRGRQQARPAAAGAPRRPPAASEDNSSDTGSDSGSGMDELVRDYLANLEEDSSSIDTDDDDDEEGDKGEGEEAEDGLRGGGRSKGDGGLKKRLKLLKKFSGVDLGDFDDSDFRGGSSSSGSESDSDSDAAFENDGGSSSGDSQDSSDGEDDSSSSESGSDSEGEEEEEEEEGGVVQGVLTLDDLEGLSLEQRYPVQARPQLPALPGQKQAGKQKTKHKSGVKGAKGGKLAPGEKARLRKERITAKRAARAAGRGFDLAVINKDLQDLVTRRGDMKAFPPMGKHECKAVQRLAALYGLKSGVQGGSKRKFVVVTVTERSALPQGEALLSVGRMLTAQFAYEVNGTAILQGPAAAAAAAAAGSGVGARGEGLGPGDSGGKKGGRWAGIRGQRGGRKGDQAGQNSVAQPKKAKKKRKLPRPMSFVSGGAINPDESVEVVMAAAISSPRGPPPDSCAVLASEGPGRRVSLSEGGSPPAAAGRGQQWAPAAAPAFAAEEAWGWPGGQPGLGSSGLGSSGLGLGAGASAAGAAAAVVGPAAAGAGELAGWGAVGLLEVFEDRRGSESDNEMEEGAASDAHPGLGSRRAVMYTRVTEAGLLGQFPVQSPQVLRCAGVGPAEGITNAGRLLGLGLALGVGPEVFGAPLASPGAGEEDDGAGPADLSPLSPLLSRSEQRRRARRQRSAATAGAAGRGWEVLEDAIPLPTAQQQAQRRDKKGKQPGAAAVAYQQEQEEAAIIEEAGGGPSALVSGDYGYFERHTTGIGSKLLAKWGFGGEGSGLGRAGQGIAEPLKASRRAKGLGLGAQK